MIVCATATFAVGFYVIKKWRFCSIPQVSGDVKYLTQGFQRDAWHAAAAQWKIDYKGGIIFIISGCLSEFFLACMCRNAVASVADDGVGIAAEAKGQVFDMFYSGANKNADNRRSQGLGLSLCKSIITEQGGEITVADNKPYGSVFTFMLLAGEVELHE